MFTRTKHGANRLSKQLTTDGITAEAIHGNKSQSARTKALHDFKKGLVTRPRSHRHCSPRDSISTSFPHVVNFELPNVPEDYVHRIGRTGRAGNEGCAYSLVCIDERKLLTDIERLLKRKIPRVVEPGYEPDPSIAAEPIQNGRGNWAKRPNQPSPRGFSSKPNRSHHSNKFISKKG